MRNKAVVKTTAPELDRGDELHEVIFPGRRKEMSRAELQRALVPVLTGWIKATCLCARVALMMFNDVILRVAFEHHASVIDLRLVCSEKTDYANPIEPSGPGGMKIAKAITRATGLGPPSAHSAVLI